MTITGALAEAVEAEQVFGAMVDQAAVTLGASSAAIYRVRRGEDVVDLVHDVGYPAAGRAALQGLRLDSPQRMPILDAIANNEPIWLRSQSELLSRYPSLVSMATPGRDYQTACLPIVVEGCCLGALAFTFDNAPPIELEERDFLLLVARYCSESRLMMAINARSMMGLGRKRDGHLAAGAMAIIGNQVAAITSWIS
jgi:GAF domain-containing protein